MDKYTFTLDELTMERIDKYVKDHELVSRSNAIRTIFKEHDKLND